VSIHALEREWNALGRTGGFAELASALEAEDEAAVGLLRQAGVRMGIGLANLLNILHPEKVILGGPVANLHPAFFETAVESALQGVYYRHSYQAEFSRGELGEAAIAVGAAVLVMNRLTV
jgi:predicted NBD/HSP70 family sugar kinase